MSGTSFTVNYGGKSLSGTINADMTTRATVGGETSTGKAVLSEGGQRLTLTWDDGSPSDVFTRK
ncbi:hypothetical protein [Streptomyces sp. XD-27]|uniref:hypothetical protein n=1 Tax=Streptomyces sp. XD-27 TaxID=3062779 RepID=UPI0026F42327|nr:hypothetical protein [Streptomyces sp. XD-27]WKX71122.1 hypothetical protein Q3Y56_15450 [Streptomyces sp. XD-27]